MFLCGNWGLFSLTMKAIDVDFTLVEIRFVDRSMSHLPSLIGEDMGVLGDLH